MLTERDDAAYCRRLTAESSSNFYYAFMFLPARRREALYTIYAYCRLIDDIVDGEGSEEQKRRALDGWRAELERSFSGRAAAHPVSRALMRAHQDFGVRHEDALAIIKGCEMDLTRARYATWQELREYCYHVASAVGLMCIEIFGYRHASARDYAIDLGLALQLTNIIRDVSEDARRGRIYLPLEDLAAFGVSEEELLCGQRNGRVLRLLQHQAQRAHIHYLRARAALRGEDRRSLAVAEIMGNIYHALLLEIERREFAVRGGEERISLPGSRKLVIALGTFLRQWRGYRGSV